MKQRIPYILLAGVLCMLAFSSCKGPVKKYAFFTQGNCAECEAIIINSLKDQKGVDSVGWDMEMGLTVVKFYPEETSPEAIQQQLAAQGFRTQYYPEDTVAAKALPACCREVVDRKLKRRELVIPSH